jgi:hypothetical protein
MDTIIDTIITNFNIKLNEDGRSRVGSQERKDDKNISFKNDELIFVYNYQTDNGSYLDEDSPEHLNKDILENSFVFKFDIKQMLMTIYLDELIYNLDRSIELLFDENIIGTYQEISQNIKLSKNKLLLYNVLKFNYDKIVIEQSGSIGRSKCHLLYNNVFYHKPINIQFDFEFDNFLSRLNNIIDNIKEFVLHPGDYSLYTGCLKDGIEVREDGKNYNNDDLKLLETYAYSIDSDIDEDDFISNYFRQHRCNFDILFKLLYGAITSSRINIIWNPHPEVNDKLFDIKNHHCIDVIKHAYVDSHQTKKLRSNILNFTCEALIEIYNCLELEYGELKLFTVFPYAYLILKHSIKHFREYNLEQWTIEDSISKELHSKISKGDIQILKVVYEDIDKDKSFTESTDNSKLFHGSTNQNWHSIMFNGLKVATKTNGLYLNGSAYGQGIYLSSTSSYSKGYSQKQTSNINNINNLNSTGKQSSNKVSSSFIDNKDEGNKQIMALLNSYIIGVFLQLKIIKTIKKQVIFM